MTRQHTDLNLLLGVIALQLDLIDGQRFAEACAAWAARKDAPLGELLLDRGWITAEDRAEIERVLRRKLDRHDGDAGLSLDLALDQSVGNLVASVITEDKDDDLGFEIGAGSPDQPGQAGIEPPTVDATAGTRERFRLVRMYAKGGLGQVWLARDPVLGREVALKELRPERAGDPAARARFLREARITGKLEHPGIVTIHELASPNKDHRSFYAMQLVRGRTLREAIRDYHGRYGSSSEGVLELHGLLDDFVAVCNAIAYAHSRGVIHRDLKGQNVVLGDFGEVVVLDWGLAKVLGQREAPTGTRANLAQLGRDWPEAESRYQQASDALDDLIAAHRKESYQQRRASLLGGWSRVRAASGRVAEAREMRERALREWTVLVREHPETIAYPDAVANEHVRLGEFAEADGQKNEAAQHYATALETWKTLAPRYPSRPDLVYSQARGLFLLARIHAAMGRRSEALKEYRDARAIWENLTGSLRDEYQRDYRADLERALTKLEADQGQSDGRG